MKKVFAEVILEFDEVKELRKPAQHTIRKALDVAVETSTTRNRITDICNTFSVRNISKIFDNTYIVEQVSDGEIFEGHDTLFTYIILNDDGTHKISTKISFTYDEQILILLGDKYLGHNSQFADFATKMLTINK